MKRFDLEKPGFEDGVHLIEASAGTGKTYCIVGMVLHLLLSGRCEIDSVLVVTFTNAATDELKCRIRAALTGARRFFSAHLRGKRPVAADGDLDWKLFAEYDDTESVEILTRALGDFDHARICTIHSFCKQVLQENAFECGAPFHTTFVDSDSDLLETAAADFLRQRVVRDRLNTVVARANDWASPGSLARIYRQARRHADAEVIPPVEENLPELQAEMREAAGEAAGAATESPLIENWKEAPFKAGKRPGCPGDDPVSAFEGLAGGDGTVDPEFPLSLTADNLGGVDRKRSILNIGSRFAKSYDAGADPVVRACDRYAAAYRRYRIRLLYDFLQEAGRRFEHAKRQQGILCFDDLLRRTHAALTDARRGSRVADAVREGYRAALIDEFQDTDGLQYAIFRMIFGERPWYIIGDPKQAIYAFRGADVYAYLEARKEAGERESTLDTNWRSHSDLVQAANLLFREQADPDSAPRRIFITEGIAFSGSRPAGDKGTADKNPLRDAAARPLTFLRFDTRFDDAHPAAVVVRSVVAEIIRLLEEGIRLGDRTVQPGDMAVLVNTNRQAAQVQRALAGAGVPAVVGQSGDIYQTEEMGQLLRIMRAVCSPSRADRIRAACATAVWGRNAKWIFELNSDDTRWQEVVAELRGYRERWVDHGFMNMFEQLASRYRVRRRFLARERGERRLTNLLQAAEVAHGEQVRLQLSPDRLVEHLERQRQGDTAGNTEQRELRLETDEKAVQVVTVHKSKGLQYPVVFCPFAWEGRQRMMDTPVVVHEGDRVVCDFGSERIGENLLQADRERLAEEMRKLYVAVTRARQRCYLAWGIPRRKGKKHVDNSALTALLAKHHREQTGNDGEDPETVSAAIDALCAQHPQVMGVREIEGRGRARWSGPEGETEALVEPRKNALTGDRFRTWVMASFSLLTRNRSVELPDHDEVEEGTGGGETAATGIHAFAAGARVGTCLHEIFERADYRRTEGEELRELVERTLTRHDLLRPERHGGAGVADPVETALQMVRRVLRKQLVFPGSATLRLDAVEMADRLAEWEFHCPLSPVVPADLRGVFERYARGWVRDGYAPLLGRLTDRSIEGFLKGYVDLVCRQDDRWFVIDWKSNRLGNDGGGYHEDHLRRAMAEHHYVLQYHLYALALHRYLRLRHREYDYERHFGGVAYAFLRGAADAADCARGFYLDRPPLALIEALDRALGTGVAS
jgi:exodeoxyribonuclease V beta subunit